MLLSLLTLSVYSNIEPTILQTYTGLWVTLSVNQHDADIRYFHLEVVNRRLL